MHQHIFDMTTALASDETWLAWCRENLGDVPTVAFEPELPTESIPDSMYPFVFLYNVKVTGASSFACEIAVGIVDEDGQKTDTVSTRVHGAQVQVSREYCAGLLNALAVLGQAVDCIHRMHLGIVDAQGETGSAVLHPFYEAWGTIAAEWKSSTRKPLGR